MIKHKSIAVSVLAVFVSAVWADRPAVIPLTDKAALTAAKGSEATVEGKVSSAEWSKSGKVCNIQFEGEPVFVGTVFEKSRKKLDAAFGGDFAKQFTGATVRITGKMADYGGHDSKYQDAGAVQIIISQTNQITVMTAATTAPAATQQTNP